LASKQRSTTYNSLTSLAKAAALITPAILLAKYAPSKAHQEFIPSDWKVWAKMLLSVASLNQINKAINWQPPPWLNAMLNVIVITPLISGLNKRTLKPLIVLAPAVGGLVQATHWVSSQAEKPLQENYNIPPLATQLALSVASMGIGFWTLPVISRLPGLAIKQDSATTAASTIVPTCASGCCSGSIFCLNELVNYSSALGNWLYNSINEKKAKL
jgi:hypothetical protein